MCDLPFTVYKGFHVFFFLSSASSLFITAASEKQEYSVYGIARVQCESLNSISICVCYFVLFHFTTI
jgi:hypothetical protein